MDRNKKTLLAEIKALLRGPVPELTIVFFEGIYHLGELLKGVRTTKEITQDQAMAILEDDQGCRVFAIYVTHQDPPENISDDLERYTWIRENQIEPDIPEEIRARINPPEGILMGVCDRECGDLMVDLFLGKWK